MQLTWAEVCIFRMWELGGEMNSVQLKTYELNVVSGWAWWGWLAATFNATGTLIYSLTSQRSIVFPLPRNISFLFLSASPPETLSFSLPLLCLSVCFKSTDLKRGGHTKWVSLLCSNLPTLGYPSWILVGFWLKFGILFHLFCPWTQLQDDMLSLQEPRWPM